LCSVFSVTSVSEDTRSKLMFNWRPTWFGGGRDPLHATLGRLEREVMDVVWSGARLTVRDVQAQLSRVVAYTTVMTTLDRLYKKGFVERTRGGRAFVYTAARTRQEVEAAVASRVLSGLLARNSGAEGPLLSNLVDVVGDRDDRLLDELELLVREKRRRLRLPKSGQP
jgi:predicted transcriptional regulator